MNNNESEVEVDPTYSVCIDYLNGGGDEKIDGARSKFHKMRKNVIGKRLLMEFIRKRGTIVNIMILMNMVTLLVMRRQGR